MGEHGAYFHQSPNLIQPNSYIVDAISQERKENKYFQSGRKLLQKKRLRNFIIFPYLTYFINSVFLMVCFIISKTHELFCSFLNKKFNIKIAPIAYSESSKRNTQEILLMQADRKEEENSSDPRGLPVSPPPPSLELPIISFPRTFDFLFIILAINSSFGTFGHLSH